MTPSANLGGWELAAPAVLLLGLILPLLAWRYHRRGNLPALTLSHTPAQATPVDALRRHGPFYCRLGALALLLLALAGPRQGESWQETTSEGIDIQVVLDISGSMAAEDFQPRDRLTVAKGVVQDFIRRRSSDRLGLVVFAGSARTRSPRTTDRETLVRLVEQVELGSLADGTAIGLALATAALRLKDSPAASKVIVLATDGANNGGAIDPRSAAGLCAGLGVKVYTVGVGTGGRVPVTRTRVDPSTGETRTERRYLEVEVDEALLQAIAERTGGRFYRATDADALERIFEQIDRLETTETVTLERRRHHPRFAPLAVGALGLLLLPLATTAVGLTAQP